MAGGDRSACRPWRTRSSRARWAETLSAIYEVDFLGFSYGFRPGRNPHQALASLHTAIMSQRVTRVLDADIRSFFDSVDHEWLLRMLAHRVADPQVIRLVRLWLEAGILESDEWHETDRGTPQGAGISPLLSTAPEFSPKVALENSPLRYGFGLNRLALPRCSEPSRDARRRAPQAVSSLDRSCALRRGGAVGTEGVPSSRPRLRRVEQRAARGVWVRFGGGPGVVASRCCAESVSSIAAGRLDIG